MELPRIVHDEILHKWEEPQEEHLAETLKQAAARNSDPHALHSTAVAIVDPVGNNEQTPLLRGAHTVVVDVAAVDAILAKEEQQVIDEDAKLTSWEIVAQEFKLLVTLAVPMMMAAMLEMIPDMALSMMIGHTSVEHSTELLAAFNLSNLFQMLMIVGLLNGIASAIDTLCSQAFGGKRLRELWLFCQGGLLVYLLCMPFVIAVICMGDPILKALGQDPVIAGIAANILVVGSLVVPFGVVFSVMKSALQAQNIVFPFVISSLVGWLISGTLAYFLAFHTSMGYMAIALATPICWLIKVLVLVPVLLRNQVFVDTWPGWRFHDAWKIVPSIAKLGVSSVLMVTFQMLGFSFISLLAGLLPNAAVMITANGIFASILALSFMPLLGICVAGAIRIGNSLGAGQARRAHIIGKVVMIASISVSSLAMVLIACIATPYAHSFTPDPEATQVASDLVHNLLPMIPLVGFTFGLQSIFRACGKQLLCAQFNFACLFVLGVPLGMLFAVKFDQGIAGLWYGNMVGLMVFTLAGLLWLRQLNWKNMAHEAKRNTQLHFVTTTTRVADAS